jgi:hypothetical protein
MVVSTKEKIDFVVTWVDGNDEHWLAERAVYMSQREDAGNSVIRYRDWGLMRYWFRGIEKFAPWVNNIYFVTWGHYPEWLNLDHPKLKLIKHTDYIPEEYLPTFNSNVIELNLHRIEELSEQFVLFNDDMFITDYVKTSDFFEKGLPCETVILGQTFAVSPEDVFSYTIFNNLAIINKYFQKKSVIKKHWKKIMSMKTGRDLLRNVLLLPFGHFSGFLDCHIPVSHLKDTFKAVWECERGLLEETSRHRFRNKGDVTHWLMKNWRTCQGEYMPRSIKWGKSFAVGHDLDMIDAVVKQRFKAVCLNDTDPNLDFDHFRKELVVAFEKILPEKSQFEKE